MGTRINYFIADQLELEESQISAILFSNNARSDYDPEARFKELATESIGPTDLVRKLLNEEPEKAGPFWLDSTAGDNEKVILVSWESGEELVMKGYTEAIPPKIITLPALTEPTLKAVKEAIAKKDGIDN